MTDLYGLAEEKKDDLLAVLASSSNKRITARDIPNSNWNFYGDKALNKSTLKQAVAKDSMRRWVNEKLSTDKTLYDEMLGVMNDNAQLFGEQLISVTLRTGVLDEIKKAPGVQRLGDVDFGFGRTFYSSYQRDDSILGLICIYFWYNFYRCRNYLEIWTKLF